MKRLNKKGFTLLELSVVIIIIAVLVSASLYSFSSIISTTRYSNTKDKLTTIVNALNRFYAANSRLPCPAQGTLTTSSASFGQEIYLSGSSGLCDVVVTPANSAEPAGTLRYLGNDGATYIRQGVVPTRALSLPDGMAYDDYGNKFTYIVTETFTTSAVTGRITVNDGELPTAISSEVAVAVISHGVDSLGAYNKNGVLTKACNATYPRGYENCDGDYTLTEAIFNDFEKASAANVFDDLMKWEDKNTVINLKPSVTSSSSSSCGYEFFVDSGTFTRPSGVTSFRVLAIGGGGGGGGGDTTQRPGGGGGGGLIDVGTLTINSDPTTVTIGAGGNGGNYNANGSAGGTTTFSTISATGGSAGNKGATTVGGAGGNGGVRGRGGVGSGSAGADGTSQSYTITAGGTVISDGTDSVTFTCATFRMPDSIDNTTTHSGGNAGNGITSELAPKFGIKEGGKSPYYNSAVTNPVSGTAGGGSGGFGCTEGYAGYGGGGGGNGGTGATGGCLGNGGGGGGYGGGGGGGGGDIGGGGGGYGGGNGGHGAAFNCTKTNGSGGGLSGAGQGGCADFGGANGGAGYGAGGGGGDDGDGGDGDGSGGGGGGGGLFYIEWDT